LSHIKEPAKIEKMSFEIIEALIGGKLPPGPERDVVFRVVHATADPDFADLMVISEDAVKAGVDALRAKRPVITDVKMLKAGVSPTRPGGPDLTHCFISDPDVAELSRKEGITRATAAMRKAAHMMDGSVVVIGNAPTALYEVIRLIREDGVRPALVIGVPVGFVGAAESKQELEGLTEAPFITNRGRKGGSAVGAAVVNALIKMSNQ